MTKVDGVGDWVSSVDVARFIGKGLDEKARADTLAAKNERLVDTLRVIRALVQSVLETGKGSAYLDAKAIYNNAHDAIIEAEAS